MMKGIKRLRQDRGLRQADIGKAVGVSQQLVSLWEHGYELKPKHREKLIQFFRKGDAEEIIQAEG